MELKVDRDIVLKFLGYGKKKPPKIIERKLDEELKVFNEYLQAEYYLKNVDIDLSKVDTVTFNNERTLKSSYLYKKLKDMDSAYIVVYTIGKKIEDIIEEYSNNAEMMKAMIVDKIGIVALDNLRDKLVEIIEDKESPKVISSVSYPSQGDFEVTYQKTLFDLFKGEDMNISISETSQFSPLKTVLLVYGIGNIKDRTSMCETCDNKCH